MLGKMYLILSAKIWHQGRSYVGCICSSHLYEQKPRFKMVAFSEWRWIVKSFLLAICLGEGYIVVHGWRGLHVRCNDRNSCARTTFWSTSIASSNRNSNSLASNLNALPMGEADVCFRRGAELEKIGQARAAHATFHEAATLYQCFLDQQVLNVEEGTEATDFAHRSDEDEEHLTANNEFGHVTNRYASADCQSVLAYTCVRLAHLSHDFLGDSKAAARLYKEATTVDPFPSSVAFDGYGTATEASCGDLPQAIQSYKKASQISPNDMVIAFHLAVALERNGQMEEANVIFDRLRRGEEATAASAALVDSWGYVRWHTRRVTNDKLNLHLGTRAMLKVGLDAAMHLINGRQDRGLVCEFGVGSGRSIRMMQELLPLHVEIHGFDTFTGLPTAWGGEPAGAYSTAGIIPKIEGNVIFHQGLFKHTIPQFLKKIPHQQPLAFANIDCDLYSSTFDVLEAVHNRIVPGTVIVFDEYLINPTWRQDEFRAWRECCKRFGWRYEYLAFSLSSKQAVVRVIEA